MASSYYEIRVAGVLPPEVLLDFERLTAAVEPVETVVRGPLEDQAALNGLLARLETFGVEVLELRRLHGRQSPPLGEGGKSWLVTRTSLTMDLSAICRPRRS